MSRRGGKKQGVQVALGVLLAIALVLWVDYASIQPARVLSVTDGDTLRASIEGETYKVRLYGIDTPETGQPFGNAATKALQDMLQTAEITIKKRDEDRYGRLVAIVYANGENVNEQLVAGGHAWWYRDYATLNPRLALAEFNARRNDRGLWQNENPTPPWEWRKARR